MPELPLVADPAFYAIAVPAVLLMGLAKSGFLAGFGSLATPLLALVVPVPQAAAIMLPLLMVMDLTGLQQLWRDADRAVLKLMLPAGLLGIGVGALLFGLLSTKAVTGIVGALTLLFVAQRAVLRPRPGGSPPSRVAGFVAGAASGFTSFVVHAGGPPFAAYVLPLKLKPVVFAGTSAVMFAAINASKWVPYAWLGMIDLRNMATALALLPLAPLGVWAGVWATRRIDPRAFYALAYAGMVATGLKLLWDGLR